MLSATHRRHSPRFGEMLLDLPEASPGSLHLSRKRGLSHGVDMSDHHKIHFRDELREARAEALCDAEEFEAFSSPSNASDRS